MLSGCSATESDRRREWERAAQQRNEEADGCPELIHVSYARKDLEE